MTNKNWLFFKRKFEAGALGHAYVFSGVNEKEKNDFVKELAKLVVGEKSSFADMMTVKSSQSKSSLENGKDMMEIAVEQIRDVQNFLSLTSYYGGYKMVVIENAERLTFEAQNCFLKSLEEPKGKTLIILLCDNSEKLLPTIASRCQEIKFISPHQAALSQEDQLLLKPVLSVLGADLSAKFAFAKQADLSGNNFKHMLEVLQKYFRNILLEKIGVKKPSQSHPWTAVQLKNIIKRIEQAYFQTVATNASPKLALEILLMEV